MATEALKAAILVAKIIHEAFVFKKECQQLRIQCLAIQDILDNKISSFHNDIATTELAEQLNECGKYLTSCKERWFVRNPFFEVIIFNGRIERYKARLQIWITTVNLSLTVLSDILHK